MRPFCAHLERETCASLGPEPAPSAPTPAPTEKPTGPQPSADAPEQLTAAVIQDVVRGANTRTRACYEKALAKEPSLGGKLTVSFTIGADGRVAAASGAGFSDKAVTTCVVKEFRGLRFPPPPGGKPVPVKYPLVFKSK